ncbi:Ubiquinone Biosynthesis Monooxygenase Coq6 [Manis pentadactyla]|nr:Ubiquinone Biosynthesis Monooxygenase Coq6 [Manis pentadactyla]
MSKTVQKTHRLKRICIKKAAGESHGLIKQPLSGSETPVSSLWCHHTKASSSTFQRKLAAGMHGHEMHRCFMQTPTTLHLPLLHQASCKVWTITSGNPAGCVSAKTVPNRT